MSRFGKRILIAATVVLAVGQAHALWAASHSDDRHAIFFPVVWAVMAVTFVVLFVVMDLSVQILRHALRSYADGDAG